jgi:hypothetical protein
MRMKRTKEGENENERKKGREETRQKELSFTRVTSVLLSTLRSYNGRL